MSSSAPPRTRETWTYWKEFSRGPSRCWRDWSTSLRRGWENCSWSSWRRGGSEEDLKMYVNIWRDDAMESGYCPVPAQKAVGMSWKTRVSLWTPFFYCVGDKVLAHIDQEGCEVSLLQEPSGHCPRQPALAVHAWATWTDDLQRALPNLTILWFCDPVIRDVYFERVVIQSSSDSGESISLFSNALVEKTVPILWSQRQ